MQQIWNNVWMFLFCVLIELVKLIYSTMYQILAFK